MIRKTIFFIGLIIVLVSCSSDDNNSGSPVIPIEPLNTISSLEYLQEFIIPNQEINGVPIGGFSGIDYKNNNWYIISDGSDPIRFYTTNIALDQNGFTTVAINSMVEIKDAIGNSFPENQINPEAIRFDPQKWKYYLH